MLAVLALIVGMRSLHGTAFLAQVTATAAEKEVKSDLAQREEHLRVYLATHGDAVDARYLLAYTLFLENKAKDSLAEYTRAAGLRRPNAADLETVALDYVLLNDYLDADRWMSRSAAENPGSLEVWYELGRIKYTENRFNEALNCFEKALAIDPRNVKAENNLGLTLEGLSRMPEAIAAYRKAIAWQQGNAHPSEQPLLNLAIALTDLQQLEEALTLTLEAERIAPRNAKVSEQLGRIYFRQGDLPKAEAALMGASALTPDNAAIHFELARVYRKEGKAELAKKETDRVVELSGTKSTPAP